MAVERTGNYKLPIPASDTAPWRRFWRELVTTLDATMGMLFTISDFVGAWDNSTAYEAGNVVLDTDNGVLYRCAATHNSAGGATTFQEDRVAHPTYWTAYASTVGFRGTWDHNVIYEKGDAIVHNDVLAIAAVGHTSSNSFDNDVAAGYWTVLIDFGSVQQAAEDAQAAAEAAAATIPTPTVANNYIRIKSDLSGYERRTPSEARSDLGADNADNITSGTLAIAYGGTGQNTAINAFNALKQAATETATGVVELATTAEAATATDTQRAVTPAGLAAFLAAVDVIDGLNLQVFTSSGVYTPAAGMKQCLVIATAGGGAGGASGTTANRGGAGGGAGGTSISLIDSATIGASQVVTVGAGGAGGSGTGGNGGDTSLGSLVTANGGIGGLIGSTPGQGGAGGNAGTGDIAIPGGHGSVGDNTVAKAGNGGGSFWGSGGGGNAVNGSGGAGRPFGAGGGGSATTDATGSDGGDGAPGVVVILEFLST